MRVLSWIPLFLGLSITAACDLVSGDSGRTEDIVVAVDDTLRDARIFYSEGVSVSEPAHLLIALHGSGDSGRSFQAGAGLDGKAPDNLIIAYPTAAKGNWAEGCNCNIADRLQINDLGFMEALIDHVSEDYQITPERTYAVGFSQGGLFAYRLGCDLSERFSHVAAVSAPMSEPLSRMCRASDPVSVMTIHGRRDGVLPYAGTDNGALSLLSADETRAFWAEKRSCGPAAETSVRSGDATVIRYDHGACEAGVQVSLLQMTNGVHAWYTSSPDNRTFLFDFFGL
ncbi:MAG: hypothetical protein HKN29_08755 [Rhodothermales bacterium]|nr:hypothetical protein [Rhodothermales bacterium]